MPLHWKVLTQQVQLLYAVMCVLTHWPMIYWSGRFLVTFPCTYPWSVASSVQVKIPWEQVEKTAHCCDGLVQALVSYDVSRQLRTSLYNSVSWCHCSCTNAASNLLHIGCSKRGIVSDSRCRGFMRTALAYVPILFSWNASHMFYPCSPLRTLTVKPEMHWCTGQSGPQKLSRTLYLWLQVTLPKVASSTGTLPGFFHQKAINVCDSYKIVLQCISCEAAAVLLCHKCIECISGPLKFTAT